MSHTDNANLYTALKHAEFDPVVGIGLARLTGDTSLSVYATEIAPGKQLKAHHHQQGVEVYLVIRGSGVMWMQGGADHNRDAAGTYRPLHKGDVLMVPAMTVHQLSNPGPDPLVMVFVCPPAHITTDRHLYTDTQQ
ncbi:cupin domain-containing protein [Sedimenticola sp.]|uniref:cupin domain-containing protein n=1 Tax=Sedimenticola sp. TaxID=1940285 RepID=UPI003D1045C8